MKITRRTKLLVVALVLCMTTMIGSTLAWFTDTVESANNVIAAGNLDVEMYWADGKNDPATTTWTDASTGAIFNYDLWEPGYVEVCHVKIENKGTLALKYDLKLMADGEVSKLAEAIDVYYADPAQQVESRALAGMTKIGTLADFIAQNADNATNTASGNLQANANHTVTLALKMREEAGNEYQGLTIGSSFKLVLRATQLMSESDSFGNTYDEDARYPGDPIYVSLSELSEALEVAENGATVILHADEKNTDNPLTETLVVDKEITLMPNGMYLVSSAPATFTVVEGGKLTVTEGSFTIKNIASNGAAVLVDGGEFVMEGGSFDAHTAVRTTEGKSSTATLAAGWSNRVTVAFDSKGNDTINVTGGSIYSSAEAIKTTSGTHLNFNMSGGLLSSRTTQYSAAVNLQGTATINMTGGKIENTYSSGTNGSPAIEANVAPTTINLSGTAALASNGVAVRLGSRLSEPAVCAERIVLNMSGNASISATSQMGFGIRYAKDCCDVIIAGNAKVNATYQAIQFNTNSYVYTNSTLLVSENATITSTAGRIGGGYAIASNGHVTITGGTINGSTAGVASFQAGAVVIVDNSQSGTPITINKVDIADGVTYTVAGNPTIG